jgi:hypothetical protein
MHMVSSERLATAKQHDTTVEIWVQNLLSQDGLQHVGMLTHFFSVCPSMCCTQSKVRGGHATMLKICMLGKQYANVISVAFAGVRIGGGGVGDLGTLSPASAGMSGASSAPAASPASSTSLRSFEVTSSSSCFTDMAHVLQT